MPKKCPFISLPIKDSNSDDKVLYGMIRNIYRANYVLQKFAFILTTYYIKNLQSVIFKTILYHLSSNTFKVVIKRE